MYTLEISVDVPIKPDQEIKLTTVLQIIKFLSLTFDIPLTNITIFFDFSGYIFLVAVTLDVV